MLEILSKAKLWTLESKQIVLAATTDLRHKASEVEGSLVACWTNVWQMHDTAVLLASETMIAFEQRLRMLQQRKKAEKQLIASWTLLHLKKQQMLGALKIWSQRTAAKQQITIAEKHVRYRALQSLLSAAWTLWHTAICRARLWHHAAVLRLAFNQKCISNVFLQWGTTVRRELFLTHVVDVLVRSAERKAQSRLLILLRILHIWRELRKLTSSESPGEGRVVAC